MITTELIACREVLEKVRAERDAALAAAARWRNVAQTCMAGIEDSFKLREAQAAFEAAEREDAK